MSYVIVCTAALLTSGLTLFSGFGLGTILMPVFALFFPVEVAVASTAMVHAANNVFKAVLLGRHADYRVLFKFALPAAVAAIGGALLLGYMSQMAPVTQYHIAGHDATVTWVKLVVSVLIVGFAVIELSPRTDALAFDERLVPFGGLISGFFGGLSGHQGALRSAFLIRTCMTKEAFIATGVLAAIIVDVSRMIVYGSTFFASDYETLKAQGGLGLVAAGTVSAFIGAFIGKRLLKKITLRAVQTVVGAMLIALGVAMGIGLV
jgi:uncharacterized membrane protein YfcA